MAPKKKTPDDFVNPFKEWSLRSPIATNQDLARLLTSPQIELLIGQDRIRVQVPQDILAHVPFFANCFNGGFKESLSNVFELPEESPSAVYAVIGWLFRGTTLKNLQGVDETNGKPLLASVLLLADKWCIEALKMACCSLICQLLEDAASPITQDNGDSGSNWAVIGDFYRALDETRYRYIPVHFAELHCFSPKASEGTWPNEIKTANRKALMTAIHNRQFWVEVCLWQGLLALSNSDFTRPRNKFREFLVLLIRDGLNNATTEAFSSLIGQGCDDEFSRWPEKDISGFIKLGLDP